MQREYGNIKLLSESCANDCIIRIVRRVHVVGTVALPNAFYSCLIPRESLVQGATSHPEVKTDKRLYTLDVSVDRNVEPQISVPRFDAIQKTIANARGKQNDPRQNALGAFAFSKEFLWSFRSSASKLTYPILLLEEMTKWNST
jgi:hypothetical protein